MPFSASQEAEVTYCGFWYIGSMSDGKTGVFREVLNNLKLTRCNFLFNLVVEILKKTLVWTSPKAYIYPTHFPGPQSLLLHSKEVIQISFKSLIMERYRSWTLLTVSSVHENHLKPFWRESKPRWFKNPVQWVWMGQSHLSNQSPSHFHPYHPPVLWNCLLGSQREHWHGISTDGRFHRAVPCCCRNLQRSQIPNCVFWIFEILYAQGSRVSPGGWEHLSQIFNNLWEAQSKFSSFSDASWEHIHLFSLTNHHRNNIHIFWTHSHHRKCNLVVI